MTDDLKRIRCNRCGMTFRVQDVPWNGNAGRFKGQIARCAEPNCRKPFWYGDHRDMDNRVRVGVAPEWLPEWQT